MSTPAPEAPEGNRLLQRLSVSDRRALLLDCEEVELTLGEALGLESQRLRHALFPITGFISLLVHTDHHPSLEVGMVGREGCFGASLALGCPNSLFRGLVQGSGLALRISATKLQAQLLRSSALRRLLQRYVFVLMSQMGSAAACLRFHAIPARLARWLLMSQDGAQSSHFPVTHEFLALMLGVRRVGITLAAGELQRQGLIRYHRGQMEVTQRAGLEAAACSCYARQRLAYAQLLGE